MIDFIFTYFPQLIGFVAIILSITGFQLNNRKHILLVHACSGLFWSSHFYLIGAFTGSAMNLIAVSRNYTFVKYRQRFDRPFLPVIFITVFTLATAATWQGYMSLLPLLGMTTATIAFWQKNPRVIRLLSLIAPPAWFAYNFISHSYPGMIFEVFIFCSILIAILRYDILKAHSARKSLKHT